MKKETLNRITIVASVAVLAVAGLSFAKAYPPTEAHPLCQYLAKQMASEAIGRHLNDPEAIGVVSFFGIAMQGFVDEAYAHYFGDEELLALGRHIAEVCAPYK